MSVYRLQPLEAALRHDAWAISRHHEVCFVVAETESMARRYANGAFILPVMPASAETSSLALPWTSDTLVDVRLVTGEPDFGLPGSAAIGTLPTLIMAAAEQDNDPATPARAAPDAAASVAGGY